VIERDGVDVPLVEYEAKLATAPFPTSLNALPKSPRAAGGVAGVVGCSTGSRGKDAKDQLAAAHKRALLPAGTTRAAELRARLKDLRAKIDDVMRDVSAGLGGLRSVRREREGGAAEQRGDEQRGRRRERVRHVQQEGGRGDRARGKVGQRGGVVNFGE
jgi:hypothetical protein